MKSKPLLIVLAASVGLMLAGCDKVKQMLGGKPSGQVVATVNGEEITTLELRAEMAGFSSRDPKVMKAGEQQALQQIILRRIAAQEARKERLDKTSDYIMQVHRGEEALLAQMLERKIAGAITPPTEREAEAYVASHPDQFANRRVMELDQIIAPAAKVDATKLQALKTLEDVKREFDVTGVPYQETSGQLDTLTAPPGLVQAVSKLPPNDVFVLPQRGAFVFNRIASQKSQPFRGDLANNFAMRLLGQQRAQETVGKRLSDLRKASEAKIVYSANYKPPPAVAKPAAGAPTAAPPPSPAK